MSDELTPDDLAILFSSDWAEPIKTTLLPNDIMITTVHLSDRAIQLDERLGINQMMSFDPTKPFETVVMRTLPGRKGTLELIKTDRQATVNEARVVHAQMVAGYECDT